MCEYIFVSLFAAFFAICATIGTAVLNFRSDYTKETSTNYEAANKAGKFNRWAMVAVCAASAIFSMVCFGLCS